MSLCLMIVGTICAWKWLRPFGPGRSGAGSIPMFNWQVNRDRYIRLILCFITAIVISSTAYICAWYESRDYELFFPEQDHTRSTIKGRSEDIQKYQKAHGKLPATLAELYPKMDSQATMVAIGGGAAAATLAVLFPKMDSQRENVRRLTDGWQRPLIYEVRNEEFDLYSYGRDGKPGGIGLDADIHSAQPWTPEHRLTLWQFSNAWGVAGIQTVCLLTGAIAFPLYFAIGKRQTPKRPSLLRVLVTVVFSILAAVAMSVLYLPSGH